MANSIVIGIDCSTTGCKAIAWDKNGRAVAEGRATYPILKPHSTWSEQNAEQWWVGVCFALGELSNTIDLTLVEALCITAQRETFVPVDDQGQPIRNAILWLDERSRDQVDFLAKTFGCAHYHSLTGKPPSMSLALPKIIWLMENEPEVIRKTAKFLDSHAYLIYRLTGNFITSLACADPMGLINMQARTWAVDIIKELGLHLNQFPDLVSPGKIIGHVNQAGSKESGLPVGLPIIAGAGDGQCAGLGVNALGKKRAYLNLGTAVVSGAFSADYLIDPAFRTHFSPLEGSYFLETVIRGGVSTTSWFIDKFAGELRSTGLPLNPEEQLEAAASKVPPGCAGLMLVPYWNSVMNPYWDTSAKGIVIGWTNAVGREQFYRAILEGIAFEQRLAGDGMMKALERHFSEYIAVGGGSQSNLWCQIMANITGIPVTRPATTEATCLGAGILAAAEVGWYPDSTSAANGMTSIIEQFIPQPEITPIYERLYQEVYLSLFPTIQHLVDHLTEISRSE